MTMPGPQFEKYLTQLLRDLVSLFVKYPADLEIKAGYASNIMDISWRGNMADTGRMIGGYDNTKKFGGETCFHMRELAKLIGERNGYEVSLGRVEKPIKGEPERYEPFQDNPNWPCKKIIDLLERTAKDAVPALWEVELNVTNLASTTIAEIVINGMFADRYLKRLRTDVERTAMENQILKEQKTEEVLRDSLRHIFKTIGNANGRLIKVTVCRGEIEQQPATAAGRFAKVKEI